MSVRLHPVPEIVDGGALEHGEEEKEDANSGGESHSGVEDVCVDAGDGDSEESDDDGELCDDTG